MRILVASCLAFAAVTSASAGSAALVPVSSPAELGAAIAAAKPGDEIVLAPGTYAVTGLSCTASGTAAAPIVVRSATPLAAKIQFDALEGFKVSGAHWHFEALDIRGVCAQDANCEHAFHVTGGADGFVLRTSRLADFNAQLKVNADMVGGAMVMPNGGLVEGNDVGDAHARNTTSPVTKLNIDTGVGWIVRANYIHDFQKLNGEATYGSFMKSGGSNGVYERNLVVCSRDLTTPNRVTIGLSFGGGGTGAQYCAPAYDPNVPCSIEHTGGTMRNNIIANCTDVGVYINRGKDTKLLYNTLVTTSGIDFRFDTTTGEARGNVLGGAIRARDAATFTDADNLAAVTDATFASWYRAPLLGDLHVKGDVSALLGKGPVLAQVTDDYCARARGAKYDLGALEHSLGDCDTTRPPLAPPGGGDAGAGDASAGSDAGVVGAGDGGAGGDASASGNGASPGASDSSGCACTSAGARSDRGASAPAVLALALLAVGCARKRSSSRTHRQYTRIEALTMRYAALAAVSIFALACSSKSSSGGAASGNTITFSMTQTVKTGSEAFACMYVQPSIDRTFFTKIAHTFTRGSHHLVLLPTDLTSIPAGQDAPHDCYAGGADFMTHARGFMYGSQIPVDAFDLPKGVAFYSDPSAVYLLQTHYVNAASNDLDATVSVTLTTSDGSDVSTKAGTLFFYDQNIHVPMGGTASAGLRCPIPQDITLLRVIPHTHARGTAFNAFLDPASGAPAAQPFYTSTDWEHPAPFPSTMQVAAGTHLRFKCDYANANGTADYFQGPSAIANEMCVFGGVYYPDMGSVVNSCPAPDQYGVGTATCSQTLDCLKPCYAMTDKTTAEHCVQSCFVQSCPGAGAALAAGGACGPPQCKSECQPGSTTCVACFQSKCPTEYAQCVSAGCN